MKTNISTIKYVFLLSVGFLLLTYAISLNDENKWIVLNSPWLSNNFVFTLAGSSFASLVVILACELQKYFILKRQAEDSIFGQLFTLYTLTSIIHYNTKRQLNNLDASVPSNLIDEIANKGLFSLNCLSSIEYTTICSQNTIMEELNQYRGNTGKLIRSFLYNTTYLKLAINEDKMDLLKQKKEDIVTSRSPKTNSTLKKIRDESSIILTYIEKSLDFIDKECKNRNHWGSIKKDIISFEEDFVAIDLLSYLNNPSIQLINR